MASGPLFIPSALEKLPPSRAGATLNQMDATQREGEIGRGGPGKGTRVEMEVPLPEAAGDGAPVSVAPAKQPSKAVPKFRSTAGFGCL